MGLGSFHNTPDEGEKKLLVNAAFRAVISEEERKVFLQRINAITDYKAYQDTAFELEGLQPGLHHAERLNETQLNKALKRNIK